MATDISRTDIINCLIAKHGYGSYLEIGVQSGKNFNAVVCKKKVGVDPDINSRATIYLESDKFFEENKEKFDIVFIDGLHHWQQVKKDIENALACLNKGGTIVCHDINPKDENSQKVPRIQSHWNGDCWIAWVKLRTRKDLKMFVIDTDEGCGVITKGKQEPLQINAGIVYRDLECNRKGLLNLISVKDWQDIGKAAPG